MPETTHDLTGFVDVAAVSELSASEGRIVEAAGTWIAVFVADGKTYAIDNACPHMAGPLGAGECHDGIVTCPIHGWRFDVRTGEAPTNPNTKVECFETRVSDGRVFVRLRENDGVRRHS
jgi:nitrite reductase (NADH) small subunit